MNIRYENATTCDIEIIFQLNKTLIEKYEDISKIDYKKVLEWVRKKIESNINEYTCIFENDNKVGYFYFHKVEEKMEVDDLYIFKEYRNRGIGTEILKKCISETNLPIFLYVFTKNTKAVSLYEKLGFKVVENIKDSRYVMERLQNIM
ncbi:MAG: GNAT family N-acetyltransferase [Clostridium sp.]|nr:GNAT family N-acetyltransferase [Clostridium sp.]